MKESNKCPNCGATIQYNEDKSVGKCPYCNSTFAGEKPLSTFDRKTATIKDLQIDESEMAKNTLHKISVPIFIILFFINPVCAIIYLIIKSSKQDK